MLLAHLNLNDEYLPYKHIIGQVILDVRFGDHLLISLRIDWRRLRKTKDSERS